MIPALTLGIEEEYLLVDPQTRDLVEEPSPDFMRECKGKLGDHVTPEFLKCQIEIGTPVCDTISDARHHLVAMRSVIVNTARNHGMAVMASSTHPFAQWGNQKHTAAERYDHLDQDMGGAIRRMLICGMHVHAGIEDEDMRIDLMNQVRYFLPHLLALSTSSPFWGGHDMKMRCSRLSVFDSMPRTGIPDRYESWAEYQRMIARLVSAGAMEDATKLWWDMRPSARFPTLEMRITDVCPRLEDALCVASLYQCLLRNLARLRQRNLRWRIYPRILLEENRWRAQRYGCAKSMIDLGRGVCQPFGALVEEIIDMVREDATALGCTKEVEHARTILSRGTSACRQITTYEHATTGGATHDEALIAVVDEIIAETVQDLPSVN